VAEATHSPNVVFHSGDVTREQRWAATGTRGATIWLTGLSGSGKSTIAAALEQRLVADGIPAYMLDGDNLRHGLNGDLGFAEADRAENVRRAGEVARLFADAGMVAIVPLISPYVADRDRVRARHAETDIRFIEVFVDTPIEECERRDPKGLYKKARAGELKNFTGIDDPYEPPLDPDLRLVPGPTPEAAASTIAALLDE
jgi:adenylyl-sulfate kinase